MSTAGVPYFPNTTTTYMMAELVLQAEANGHEFKKINGSSSCSMAATTGNRDERKSCGGGGGGSGGYYCFQMPLHYPRYKKSDYESMPEWKLDCLLKEYGLPITGDLSHKRKFAMGTFLWPSQY